MTVIVILYSFFNFGRFTFCTNSFSLLLMCDRIDFLPMILFTITNNLALQERVSELKLLILRGDPNSP